jgi:uracil-DNA glycosylase
MDLEADGLSRRLPELERAAPSLEESLPDDWRRALAQACAAPSFVELERFLEAERARPETAIYPLADDLFAALRLTPLDSVRAVILGQDPYHGEGEAHGLSFSVRAGTKVPPSLRNIIRELVEDVGEEAAPAPGSGSLEGWARNGVLLLNTVLTVRRDEPYSHRQRGWEPFTDAIIGAVSGRSEPVAFLLWGAAAQASRGLIDDRHVVVSSNHPSPLSANSPPVPFRGSRPFSAVNTRLEVLGRPPIDWRLGSSGDR